MASDIQVEQHVVEAGERRFTIRVYRDDEQQFYALLFDEQDETSPDYQLWIAPYRSRHPTAKEAADEAAQAVIDGLEADLYEYE